MERLAAHDLRVLLALLREIYETRDQDRFRAEVVSKLSTVIPAEIVGYAELDPSKAVSENLFWPADAHDPARDRAWERHMHEHPVLTHYVRTRDGRAYKLSDFLTR